MRQNGRSRSPPPPDYFDRECLLEAISSQSFLDSLRSMAWFSDPRLGFFMRDRHFTTLTSQSRRIMGTVVFRITGLDFPIKSSTFCPPATLSFLWHLTQETRYALFAVNHGCLNPPLERLVAGPYYLAWAIHLIPNWQHLREKHPTCDQPLIILEPGALPPPSVPGFVVAPVRKKVRQKYDHWR